MEKSLKNQTEQLDSYFDSNTEENSGMSLSKFRAFMAGVQRLRSVVQLMNVSQKVNETNMVILSCPFPVC